MSGDAPISWLMFFTFAAVIFVIAGYSIYFLRRRINRQIAEHALAGEGKSGPAPDGALPELLAVSLFAFIAMGLLTAGYVHKPPSERNQAAPLVGGPMPKS